jgi:type III restriction enzyme
MELKRFQGSALADVESYLSRYLASGDAALAWRNHWLAKGVEPDRRYVDRLGGIPDVCVKIPTGGGKTFLACNALAPLAGALMGGRGLVVWYVPSLAILSQTIAALRDPEHPYRRKLESLFAGRVKAISKADALAGTDFSPDSLSRGITVLVASYDSFRAANKEGRKVYRENSSLVAFNASGDEGADEASLVAAIRAQKPIVVVDESHNATTELSVDMIKVLSPRFVLELTATPHPDSNIVSIAEPAALKREEMVKLPVIVYNAPDVQALVATAIDMRRKLESLAKAERSSGGPYVRPIALFQAEPKSRDDATTFRRVKEKLLSFGIPDAQVKIKTAEVDELEGLDLMSESCPVRYVITVNALKEGWDCPFAYVLASLADRSSAVDVQQIVGRVLRRPYARRFENRFLNLSFVFTSSSRFLETLDTVVKGLNRAGFGDDDYRVEESQRVPTPVPPAGAAPLLEDLDKVTYREQPENEDYAAPTASAGERPSGPSYGSAGLDDGVAAESLDVAAVSRLVAGVEAAPAEAAPRELREAVFAGIGSLKTYPLKDEFRTAALAIKLPVFRIAADPGGLFGSEGSRDLEKEDLLDDFRLGLEEADIALPLASVDLYQVDLEGAEGDTRLERRRLDLPEAERFLSFLKSLSDADFKRELLGVVMSLLRDVDAVSDRDLKAYVKRVIEGQAEATLAEMRGEPYRYAQAIRAKIDGIMTEHARRRFFEDTTTNAVFAEPRWAFPQRLECAEARRGLPRSLYDACPPLNSFEAQVAEALSSSPNVLFWHRNRERKDFKLNGFINHYPDFIALTRSGNSLLVESKGDDRDNSDSERKLALGKEWERLAGPKYKYFMVFQTREVEGAWPMAEALRLIAKL